MSRSSTSSRYRRAFGVHDEQLAVHVMHDVILEALNGRTLPYDASDNAALLPVLYHSWRRAYQVPLAKAALIVAFLLPPMPPLTEKMTAEIRAEVDAMPPERPEWASNEQLVAERHNCAMIRNSSLITSLTRRVSSWQTLRIITFSPAYGCDREALNMSFPPLAHAVETLLTGLDFDNVIPPTLRPQILQVPYVERMRDNLPSYPWQSTHKRRFLTSFIGSTNALNPILVGLRRLIVSHCRAVGEPLCKLVNFDDLQGQTGESDWREVHRSSTFCLEPPGYGVTRRSTTQVLTAGCIPVTFLTDEERDVYYPFFTRGWLLNATVNFDRTHIRRRVRANQSLDIIGELSAIPRERVAAMQRTIALHAQAFTYPLIGKVGLPGGASELLLRALHPPYDDPRVGSRTEHAGSVW